MTIKVKTLSIAEQVIRPFNSCWGRSSESLEMGVSDVREPMVSSWLFLILEHTGSEADQKCNWVWPQWQLRRVLRELHR